MNDDTPKLTALPTKPDEFRAAVEQMKRSEETYLEMAALYARIRFAYFLAYKGAGFSDEQALELCKRAPL
jgi:hypothetical protein